MIGSETKERFVDLVVVLFIALFIYASVNKLTDVDAFLLQLSKSPLLFDITFLVAWSIPAVEIFIALLLMFERTRTVGLYASLFLMSLFTGYIFSILNFSEYIPCSCGGILGKMGWQEHLIFNGLFIALAIAAVLLSPNSAGQSLIKSTIVLTVAGLAITSLFAMQYDDRDKYSSFDRRMINSPLVERSKTDLEVNSYYFAGYHDSLYLGNVTAPLFALSVDTALHNKVPHRIQIPYGYTGSTSLRTIKSDFFMIEGASGKVYSGKLDRWIARNVNFNATNINDAVPFSAVSLLSRTFDGRSRTYGLELLSADRPTTPSPGLLQKQIDGLFCVDGMMRAFPQSNTLVYVYHYRNQYIVMDTLLNVKRRGKTIDSISHAKIQVQDLGNGYRSLASNPVYVSKMSCIGPNRLYIASGIRARNQSDVEFSSTTTVDVYDLIENQYEFSFIIPHSYGRPRDMLVKGNSLYVLVGDFVVAYDLAGMFLRNEHEDILQGQ